MIKKVRVENAIGKRLCHDLTKIIPGKFKGVGFKRGHIIKEDDVIELLKMGKSHIYVLELEEGEIHEEDAAKRIALAISGNNLELTDPKEGKVNIKAKIDGLLKIKPDILEMVNSIEDISVATLHNNYPCEKGKIVAGIRIIPLFIEDLKIRKIEEICEKNGKFINILPFREKKIGIVVTGTEIFNGLIKDKSADIVEAKIKKYGSYCIDRIVVPDDINLIKDAIFKLREEKAQVIILTGGMSVDPDDVTKEGVKASGANIISYGAPVHPGSMFLYALFRNIPILGLPACVVHDDTTIFDFILPRILSDDIIERSDIIKLGHGGLCLKCPACNFPICPFGKG
jgi:molybdenum cofactor synthesis domain-containing protein